MPFTRKWEGVIRRIPKHTKTPHFNISGSLLQNQYTCTSAHGLAKTLYPNGSGFVSYMCDLQVMKDECQQMFKELQAIAGESLPESTLLTTFVSHIHLGSPKDSIHTVLTHVNRNRYPYHNTWGV